jgi:hypothetical protein
MKTILIHSISGNNENLFNPNERDGYNDPLIYLRERLYQKGYLLKASNDAILDNCEWVFFYDEPSVNPYKGWRGLASRLKSIILWKPLSRNLYQECINRGMKNRIVLFLWEPPSVLSLNWDKNLHKLFPIIFTWHDGFIDGRKIIKIYWPQTRLFPTVPIIDFKEKKLLVNISMNKSSSHPRELYSKRLNAIRHFEQNQPESFDLYGVGWNYPTYPIKKEANNTVQIYPSYRGTVLNKWDVLPKYKFSLCYENIHDEPGFITEKIFDCFRARCVPIYWGASNITEYVDKNAFIDRRDFNSNKELENHITGITEQKYNDIQDAIHNYLNSDRFAKFLPPNFAETIINTLKL